jgi:AcrR family transcriptional regulator
MGRTAAAVTDRRSVILAAAADLFASRGVAATTVRDIGDGSGILSGSLYHYFDSKESMAAEIVLGYLDELLERYEVIASEPDPRVRLESLIRATFAVIAEHPAACAIYQNDYHYLATLPKLGRLPELAERVHDHWVAAVLAGADAGCVRREIDPDVFYRLAGHAVLSSVRWFVPRADSTYADLADDAITVLLDGFCVAPTQPSAPRRRANPRSTLRTTAEKEQP